MNSTTWSQGVRQEENKNYKVSWKYHPKKGLKVMFETK